MAYAQNASIIQRDLAERLSTPSRGRSPFEFVESPSAQVAFEATREEVRSTGLFNSRSYGESKFFGPQKQQLADMVERGELTPAEVNVFKHTRTRARRSSIDTDWVGLAEYVNGEKGTEFDFSYEALNTFIRTEAEERGKLLNNVEGWGPTLASFAGGTQAYFTDPTTIAMLLTPAATFRYGATLASTMAKMAFREAAVNTGFEGVIQLNMADFKRSVGLEYGLSDAAAGLLSAWVIGGAVGAGRAVYRSANGILPVSAHVEAGDTVIAKIRSDFEASGITTPEARSIVEWKLDEATQLNDMLRAIPDQNMSYDDAIKRIPNLRTMTPAEALAEQQSAAIARVADQVKDSESRALDDPATLFVQTVDDNAPVAFVTEEGVGASRTFKEVSDEIDAQAAAKDTAYDNFVACVRGA